MINRLRISDFGFRIIAGTAIVAALVLVPVTEAIVFFTVAQRSEHYEPAPPPPGGWQSAAVTVDGEGNLSYTDFADVDDGSLDNHIPDFSYAGYKMGMEDWPSGTVYTTLTSTATETEIESALAAAAGSGTASNPAVVVLSAGTYTISTNIEIDESNVILRGEGNGTNPASDTILEFTSTSSISGIILGGSGSYFWTDTTGSGTNITDTVVEMGDTTFTVSDSTGFAVDDVVLIRHPATSTWLTAIDYGGLPSGSTAWGTEKDTHYLRTITAIDGNDITIDAPMYMDLVKATSQCDMIKFDNGSRISGSGVENLRVSIQTASSTDENHIKTAVELRHGDNLWAEDVIAEHFWYSGFLASQGVSRSTVKDCQAIDPHGVRTGSRMYNFCANNAQLFLFDTCRSEDARHAFVIDASNAGHTAASGVVWRYCTSVDATADSGGHRTLAQGLLFDNCTWETSPTYQTEHLTMANNGNAGGSGNTHGWGCMNSVAWNTTVTGLMDEIVVQKPPLGQNWVIGAQGASVSYTDDGGSFNTGRGVPAGGVGTIVEGYIEGTGVPDLAPQSLYDAQLAERLDVNTIRYYVATTGNDANAGTQAAPFLTLQAARDALRTATNRTSDGTSTPTGSWSQGAEIHIAAGTYYLATPLQLDERDGGTSAFDVKWYASPGTEVIVTGAISVDGGDWDLVTSADSVAWAEIPSAYRGDCYVLDVTAGGWDQGTLAAHTNGFTDALQLINADELRKFSRWPDAAETAAGGWVLIDSSSDGSQGGASSITFSESGPGSWGNITNQDVFAYGHFSRPWTVHWEYITSASTSGGSTMGFTRNSYYDLEEYNSGTSEFPIALRNQLNVIQQGRYVWNKTRGKIYYRPEDSEAGAPDARLIIQDYVMQLGTDESASDAVQYLTFENLTFEGTRGAAMRAYYADNITFTNCNWKNAYSAWEIEDCSNFAVTSGRTEHMSQFAGTIHGGTKSTLTHANITFTNHTITDIGFHLGDNSGAAVWIGDADNNAACGVTFDNCTVSYTRDAAVKVIGAENTFSDCTFDQFGLVQGDAGGVSTASAYCFGFTNAGNSVTGCTFSNSPVMPIISTTYESHYALYSVYLDFQAYWTVEDCMFDTVHHAFNIAAGKYHTLQRNTMTDAFGNHKVSVVIGNRDSYSTAGEAAWDNDEADVPDLSVAPWSTSYPGLNNIHGTDKSYVSSGYIYRYPYEVTIVDNLSTNAHAEYPNAMIRVATQNISPNSKTNGTAGVDMTQLNYPVPTTPSGSEPDQGGGTDALSTMYRN